MRAARIAVVAGFLILAGSFGARAQEMEPRAYSPSPVGMNFLAVIGGGMRGEILFDPSIPVTDVQADLGLATLGYGRTFGLWERQGLVALAVPYGWGYIEGKVFEQSRQVWRSGLGDMRVKASLNLMGPKAMSVQEFQKAPRRTIMGVSLTVQAPTGQYDETKLINLGTNRWAFKPEVGVSVPVGRWYLDAYAGAWFFTNNEHFYPGESERRQDPLVALQGHASYTFANRAWVAIDATWYGGGSSTVDSGAPSARQSNTRVGGTCSFPITAKQSVKFAASTGASTRTGTDFDTFIAAWQIAWFDRPHTPKP